MTRTGHRQTQDCITEGNTVRKNCMKIWLANNPYIAFEAQEERDNTMAADGNSSELNNTSSKSANNSPVIAKKSRWVLNRSQLDND